MESRTNANAGSMPAANASAFASTSQSARKNCDVRASARFSNSSGSIADAGSGSARAVSSSGAITDCAVPVAPRGVAPRLVRGHLDWRRDDEDAQRQGETAIRFAPDPTDSPARHCDLQCLDSNSNRNDNEQPDESTAKPRRQRVPDARSVQPNDVRYSLAQRESHRARGVCGNKAHAGSRPDHGTKPA